MNILLMGNPNVGKSVVFSRLTGTNVTSSNYPGTTVEYTEGFFHWKEEVFHVIDVPGVYTLDPTNKAEEVAVDMIDKGDIIINVVDATNLERNMNLTLQLLEKNIPVIIALNFWDEANHKGIKIDSEELESILNVPVIPTTAVKGHGIAELINTVINYDQKYHSHHERNDEERWVIIGKIVKRVQQISDRKHTFSDIIDEITIKPLSGLPIALAVLYVAFRFIIFMGEGIIGYITEPFFD